MIILVIIGAFIGAGFASGQEIYLFFYKYGINGIFGLALCSIMIGVVIYKTVLIIKKYDINTYNEFLNIIFNKNKIIAEIMNLIINLFLLVTFFIMISGFGAYFKQELSISNIVGATLLASICFLVFMTDIKGVAKINSIIVPILICFICIIGIKNLTQISFGDIEANLTVQKFEFGWILSSLLYCSYNMILIIPVIVSLKDYIKSKKQIYLISVVTSVIIFILGLFIFLLMININTDFSSIEMPAVYVITQNFTQFKLIYGIVILFSIFTTSISIGISFLENIVKNENNFPQIAGIMCITSIIISNFGFSNLVKILFPIFGGLGLVQIYKIIENSKFIDKRYN